MRLKFMHLQTINANSPKLSVLTIKNLEALSDSENVNWNELKLKQEKCTCADGKSGVTLKCLKDGDLEQCSATQQGSIACYKVGLSGLKLCS